ncbi:MAG: hypothetical protein ACI8X5_001401 [Planctomycetota bacterium]|jgi:hypothetical protein
MKGKSSNNRRGSWLSLLFVLPFHTVGWLALTLSLTTLFVDRSGLGKHELESLLAARLSPLGSSVSIGALHFDWLGPGLTVEDLRILSGDRENLHIEHIYVSVGLGDNFRPILKRVHVDGGRVLLSENTAEELRAIANTTEQDDLEPIQLPSIQVRGLSVDLEVPGFEASNLGSIDLSMESESTAPERITGRLLLPSRHGSEETTEIFISGLVDLQGDLQVHAITDQLNIDAWDTPAFMPVSRIRELAPQGQLSLHATGGLSLAGELTPHGTIRLKLADGSLQLPTVSAGVEDLTVEAFCRFEPGLDEDYWSPQSWAGSARIRASWDGQELTAGLRLGDSARAGKSLEAWLNAPDFNLRTPAITALETPDILPTIYGALDPYGQVNLRFGITCDGDYMPGMDLWPAIEYSVLIQNNSQLQAAYHGWPDIDQPNVKPMSFALPAKVDEALVVYAHTKRFPRHNLLDTRFTGKHPNGPFHGSYQQWSNPVDMPPFAPGYGRFESELLITVPEIAIDKALNSYLPGLWEIPELTEIYGDYGLGQSGRAAVHLRLCSRANIPNSALWLEIAAHDLRAAEMNLPVPARDVKADVLVIDDGRQASCISFAAKGRTESILELKVAGRSRREALEPGLGERLPRFGLIDIELQGIDVQGSDLDIAAEYLPEVMEAVAAFAPRGSAGLHFVRQEQTELDVRMWGEVTPTGSGFSLYPEVFGIQCDGVRGRVFVDIEGLLLPREGYDLATPNLPRNLVRIAPLITTWRDEYPAACSVEFSSDADLVGKVIGAGLRPADRGLLADIAVALDKNPRELLAEFEPFQFGGAVDFDYEFRIPEDPDLFEGLLDLQLRDNDVAKRTGLTLSRLQGKVQHRGDTLHSPRISAQLGKTPIALKQVAIVLAEGEIRSEADLEAEGIVIDADLLGQFFEPESVTHMLEDLKLRGTIDVNEGHMKLRFKDDLEPELTFTGEATLSDALIVAKAPLEIRSARIDIQEFFLQGDDLRGWGTISDLYGRVLGRDLAQVELMVSLFGTQFTIEQLSGQFCRGQLAAIAAPKSDGRSEPVLSIDLQPPYRFQTGLSLADVDVGLLLQDVLSSEIAARGLLDAQFRLRGELDDLYGIKGSGYAGIRQTILWSVPVVRDLFGQLGLDETAVFDEMESDFRIEYGQVLLDGMRVHSPLLSLRGSGSVGFDGSLDQRLQITYSLIDKTGPFKALIYWLQDNLLAIAVRGDMSKPKIITLGVFSSPFVSPEDHWRSLPSPGFSKLPERF